MFNATYFEETNSTVFTLEIKYNNDDNVVTCLPISRIEIKKRDSSTNFATCFNQNLSSCVPEYTNSYEPVESGFQYNLSVNAPFATSDAFTLAVVGSSVATPNGTTSTTVILSTTTFSTSANITVITSKMRERGGGAVADLGGGLGGPGPPKNFSDEVLISFIYVNCEAAAVLDYVNNL